MSLKSATTSERAMWSMFALMVPLLGWFGTRLIEVERSLPRDNECMCFRELDRHTVEDERLQLQIDRIEGQLREVVK